MAITVTQTKLNGVVLIEPEVRGDARGFFYESYRKQHLEDAGIHVDFVQDNHSKSAQGVLRGLHYQDMRQPLVKLVRCTAGAVLDVVVDLRSESATRGQWVAVELSAENRKQILVPVGFGHGFLVLSEVAELQYKCSDYYAAHTEGAIAWNDPDLGIDWGGIIAPTLSARDQVAMSFKHYLADPAFQ